ncbi:hypothetical protein Ahy_B05g078712 [Arachis hypogaea]|uniref:Protein kinase domain-containing protein n=1 Tax=Arachis hypogaea TaxID=3818 RepID=A0A444Z7V2_ARAHY|nr:hypothetical protein Ahy_B05g078712 [Arachis hypogaea]
MPPSTSAMLREFHGTLQHVQHKLVSIDGNASHSENCFKFTILYAAAFVNQYGPESNGAMSCIFGVYVWYDRKVRRKKLNNDEFDFDPEEQGSRRVDLGLGFKRILESDFKGDVEFCNEVEIISNLKHQNLVPLRGCCVVDDDDEKFNDKGSQRFLVYDYMSNGNLEDHLFLVSEQQKLKKSQTWPQRKSIILDVAKGLTYLSCDACVHGDVFIVQIGIRVYPLQGLI